MSLLPKQIPPAATPWGKVNKDGTVMIDPNWWLFLLNVPLPQAPQSVTVTASPFIYTAVAYGLLSIIGGTVSAIVIIRQGTTVPTGITSGLIQLARQDQVKVTYSAVPTINFLPSSS